MLYKINEENNGSFYVESSKPIDLAQAWKFLRKDSKLKGPLTITITELQPINERYFWTKVKS